MVSVFFGICNILNSHASYQRAVLLYFPMNLYCVVSMSAVIQSLNKGNGYEILTNDPGSGVPAIRYGG